MPKSMQALPLERGRFLSRAEMATLLGMVLVIFSLFLAWEKRVMSAVVPVPVLYGHLSELTMSGFATTVHWPLILCAIFCGLLLLCPLSGSTRLPVVLAQGACAMTCVVLALTKLAPLPGVLVGLVGGILLLLGAIDRYQTSVTPE